MEADDQLLVVVTHARIRSQGHDAFNHLVDQVESTLTSMPGLYGYSLRKELLGDQAWTMTVWSDESSMFDFNSSQVHIHAMSSAKSLLKQARFARVQVDRADLPYSWDDAIQLLETQSRAYDFN